MQHNLSAVLISVRGQFEVSRGASHRRGGRTLFCAALA